MINYFLLFLKLLKKVFTFVVITMKNLFIHTWWWTLHNSVIVN